MKDESCDFFFFLLQGSAADGPRGLSVGDIITGLEDCPVSGVEDWTSCLSHLSHTPQMGYCVPAASLQPSWAHGRGAWRIRQNTDADVIAFSVKFLEDETRLDPTHR